MPDSVELPEGVESFGIAHRIEGRVEVVRVSDLPTILAAERERLKEELQPQRAIEAEDKLAAIQEARGAYYTLAGLEEMLALILGEEESDAG